MKPSCIPKPYLPARYSRPSPKKISLKPKVLEIQPKTKRWLTVPKVETSQWVVPPEHADLVLASSRTEENQSHSNKVMQIVQTQLKRQTKLRGVSKVGTSWRGVSYVCTAALPNSSLLNLYSLSELDWQTQTVGESSIEQGCERCF